MTKRQPETEALISYLKTCADSKAVANYEAISNAVGFDVLKNRSRLSRAIEALQKDYGYVATCLPQVGYQFLKDGAVIDTVAKQFESKIRNQVERTESQLQAIDWNHLNPTEVKNAIACSIRVQAHRQLTSPLFKLASFEVASRNDKFLDSAKAAAELMKAIG
ncbi:hypothetical protein [Iningainema tapete]|uniref:Uncharacterized protein n=1 Tax=Iningainema tapete BLCC-T55 TaxID=2748662 RepID=A0A8J6XI59_9CYAN|nr:hypothetical protein [Iningainema tapete]MBD2771156.1 hypothetical protein [Iningainema tapete BLCC-T55]